MIEQTTLQMIRPGLKPVLAGILFVFFSYSECWAGTFLLNDVFPDIVTHPEGYTGANNQQLNLNICIDASSLNANDMVVPLQNVINTWNQLLETTGNVNLNQLDPGKIDVESVVLHEIGHCIGLGHPNVASNWGTGSPSNSTASSKGGNSSYNLNAGSDGIYGSADDVRGDDENLHWFNADNDPFVVIRPVDQSSYFRDISNLPVGDNFAVNGDRSVSNAMGYMNTEAAMQQETFARETQRMLAADDVSSLLFARAEKDRSYATADDYTVNLNYYGIVANPSSDSNCDITVSIDEPASFAYCSTSSAILSFIAPQSAAIKTAEIHLGTAFNWYFNQVSNAPPDYFNFNDLTLTSYAGSQDDSGSGPVGIEDAGNSLRLTGNRWQQVEINYTVTADTVIEFDFSSATEAEIQGIGFNDDLEFNAEHTFQLFGTQTWGLQNYHNYETGSGVKHYVIPVGQFYTGLMQYLFFVNDHDVASPDGESLFSNILVYENTETLQSPTITSTPASSVTVNQPYVYDADGTAEASGSAPINFSLDQGPAGLTISASGLVSWTPVTGQEGTHSVTILASNAAGSTSQNFSITVSPVTPPPDNVLNFNDLTLASYAGNQDTTGSVSIEDDTVVGDGARLRLNGNRWQQVELNYPITTNTVIEFDFSSDTEGEIHGIGFNDNLNFIENHTFQLSGSQLWGNQTYFGYITGSGVQHYVIPVGKYYQGEQKYLYFVNDHDVTSPNAESVFSNIQVYESN